ncbi:glycosyltransferase [Syntrophomonas erecta]
MSKISCILYPPTLDYHYLVQRPQQLMKNFSELGIPVFYLNRPSPNSGLQSGIHQINPYFHLFNNIDPSPYLKDIRPVVYYSATAHVDQIMQYNPGLVVFDSVDEPSDEFEAWRPYYHRAVSSADIVITTSEKLYAMARSINPATYLVPNGCDFNYFVQASNKAFPVPDDMQGLTGPIIGYVGVIASWLDFQLIEQLALGFPHCQIVMVGPLYNVSDVPRHPNIHYLGFKAYEQLAAYTQMFDVGIIPFRSSSMVESVNPIKMWEYMASGMPIVTSDLPEANKYGDLVLYSQTYQQFMDNIKLALEHDDQEKRAARIALAQENSWLSRAKQIVNIIEVHLSEKGYNEESVSVPTSASAPAAGPGPTPEAGAGPAPAAGPGPTPAAGPGPTPAAGPGPTPAAGPGPTPAAGPGLAPEAGAVPAPALVPTTDIIPRQPQPPVLQGDFPLYINVLSSYLRFKVTRGVAFQISSGKWRGGLYRVSRTGPSKVSAETGSATIRVIGKAAFRHITLRGQQAVNV